MIKWFKADKQARSYPLCLFYDKGIRLECNFLAQRYDFLRFQNIYYFIAIFLHNSKGTGEKI